LGVSQLLICTYPHAALGFARFCKTDYLPHMLRNGVQLAEIPHCGHFPMYSNPVRMWARIAEFLG
ncbi:alpha/beta fold hydrolase, partial [Caballeronia arationis]|uniref:alpha/beta fold hydrolase n=1 Tax=Caballeronia arationis TaxID=1777142 RepID=UPI000AEF69E1